MRILVLTNMYPPDVVGGYELGCSHVVEALRALNHDVQVLTSIPDLHSHDEPYVERSLRLAGIHEHERMIPRSHLARQLFDFESHLLNAANVYVLLRALERVQPDVVYLWNLVGIGGLGLLNTIHDLELPRVWHLMDVPWALSAIGLPLLPDLTGTLARNFDGHYLACSQRVVDEARRAGVTIRGHVEILPNWVRGSRPAPRSHYFSGGDLRIVSSGRVARHKGVDILIEAAAHLQEWGFFNFTVDVYGTIADYSLEAMITQLDVRDRVGLKGFRSQAELYSLYDDYDVFAFPTWSREPFGFAPLEAAAHGCVALVTDDCGYAEWMVDGVHCVKSSRSSIAFARHIAAILQGEVPLEALARRSVDVIWRDFHLDSVVPKIEGILETAIKGGGGAPRRVSEIYRLAVIAEKLGRVLIEESHYRQLAAAVERPAQ